MQSSSWVVIRERERTMEYELLNYDIGFSFKCYSIAIVGS